MIIKMDVRESDLIEKIGQVLGNFNKSGNLSLKTEALSLGDVVISTENGVDLVIIERKTVADLLASIKDGRYEEQSYRLNGLAQHHNHNIIYLIEGDVARTHSSSDKLIAYSAMFSLNYYKGFSVFRSFSLEESATIVCNMAYKLDKGTKLPYYSAVEDGAAAAAATNDDNAPSAKDYIGVVKKVKKENITSDNIGEIMLCQIPGISSVTAVAIMHKFTTIAELVYAIEADKTCLTGIVTTDSNGKTRKISQTCIANIVKYFSRK